MAGEYHNINSSVSDRVCQIVFNRPPLNILNIAMMREINAALEECARRTDLVALVFRAAPQARAFSVGVAVEEHVPETIKEMLDSFHAIFRALERVAKPTIAVVDGPALGGGCELVAACDIVIASERATFGQPEIKLGVFPPVAAILLPRIIGEKKARELILTGDAIDAAEARHLGLLNYVVKEDELEEKLETVVDKLRQLSASSLRMTRTALDLGSRDDFASALKQIEGLYLNGLIKTADADEGLRAFMEKRKPAWRDK
jgi:cyclohexa-1,5-dienecarbonyl-CoA hydratase